MEARGPPKTGFRGRKKGYKTQWILTICGLEASQGGSKQQDHEEEQREGLLEVPLVDRCHP